MAILIQCLKCREKTDSKDIVSTTTKNGKEMVRATCSVCGCKKSKIGAVPAES